MIFTPEESREIAEGMLGWEYVYDPCAPAARYAHFYRHDGTISYREGLDFSLPEWTGSMLGAIRGRWLPNAQYCMSIDVRYGWVDVIFGRLGESFRDSNRNRNIYDAWKWLRGKEEATDVQS
jgi:hypothetical protein